MKLLYTSQYIHAVSWPLAYPLFFPLPLLSRASGYSDFFFVRVFWLNKTHWVGLFICVHDCRNLVFLYFIYYNSNTNGVERLTKMSFGFCCVWRDSLNEHVASYGSGKTWRWSQWKIQQTAHVLASSYLVHDMQCVPPDALFLTESYAAADGCRKVIKVSGKCWASSKSIERRQMKQNKNKNTNNMNANKIAQNSSVVWQFGLVGELRLQRHQRAGFY